MLDGPAAEELIRSVAAYLRKGGGGRFEDRVAANALQTALRELELRDRHHAAEHERLRALLGCDGTLEELNGRLSDCLRQSPDSLPSGPLEAHLWATTMEKLAIDQPSYASYRAELDDEVSQ